MTTTTSFLQSEDGAELCFVCVIEGLPHVWTSNGDTTVKTTGWAAAGEWYSDAEWHCGEMNLIGKVGQKIKLFDSSIDVDGLEIAISDTDGDLAALMFAEASSTATTPLTSSADADALSWVVLSTGAFAAAPGFVYCGNETAYYTSKTGTTFDFAAATDRGRFAVFTTSTGDPFAYPHLVDTNTASQPIVSSSPRTFWNRGVAVYLHHKEGAAWCTKADAKLLWTGRIQDVRDDSGDGSVRISCTSVIEGLFTTLLDNQYTAELKHGVRVRANSRDVQINSERYIGGSSTIIPKDAPRTRLLDDDTIYSHQQAVSALNNQFQSWTNAGTIYPGFSTQDGSLAFRLQASGYYRLEANFANPPGADTYKIHVFLHPIICELLGFPHGSETLDQQSDALARIDLIQDPDTDTLFCATGTSVPAANLLPKVQHGDTFSVEKGTSRGVFSVQPVDSIPPNYQPGNSGSAEGFLLVGNSQLFSVKSIGTDTWRVNQTAGPELTVLGSDYQPGELDSVRTSDQEPIKVKQVWIQLGATDVVLKELILSTGSSGFNDPDYDTNGVTMGCAVPSSAVNADSLSYAVGDDDFLLVVDKPTPSRKIIESALGVSNAFCIWRDGQMEFVRSSSLAEPAAGSALWALTEDNKAARHPGSGGEGDAVWRDPQRVIVSKSPDGVINIAKLQYHRDLGGTFHREVTVNMQSSISDFGKRRMVKVEGLGIYDSAFTATAGAADRWAMSVATPALTYCSRPLNIVRRSFDSSLVEMCPGDTATISDNYLINPATGLRGVSLLPCWVLSASFDWTTGVGVCELAFLPELPVSKIGAWAPSALVSSYVNGTKTLTCAAHQYSLSGDAADASRFVAGDKIQIIEISPSNPAAPQTYTDVVASVSGNDVVLTTGLGGAIAAGTYVLQYDDVLTVQATQTAKTFIADDADGSTGLVANDHYLWQGDPAFSQAPPAPVYTTQYKKIRNVDDDKGQPLSAGPFADTVENLNCLLAYKTTQHLVGDLFVTAYTQTGTSEKLVYSCWVPCYGRRNLLVAANIKTASGSSYCKFYSSDGEVSGTSSTALSFTDGGLYSATVSTAVTSYAWTSEVSLTPHRTSADPGEGTWIHCVLYASAGGITASLRGLSVREDVV